MEQNKKTWLVYVALSILAVHFIFLFINNNPFSEKKDKLYFYSQAYTYPFFHQTWQLFAPPPTTNFKLIATFNTGGRRCVDVFNEILTNHQSNRMLGYEPLLLSFATGLHFFEKTAAYNNFLSGYAKNYEGFNIIEHMSRSYLYNKYHLTNQTVKLTLIVYDTKQTQSRVYFN